MCYFCSIVLLGAKYLWCFLLSWGYSKIKRGCYRDGFRLYFFVDLFDFLPKDEKNYGKVCLDYCLDNTMCILKEKFKDCNIYAVLSASFRNGLACFDHLTRPGFGIAHLEIIIPTTQPNVMVINKRLLACNNFLFIRLGFRKEVLFSIISLLRQQQKNCT